MRQILASRAINSIFRSPDCQIMITKSHLIIKNEDEGKRRGQQVSLGNVAYWMTHKDNDRLFAFISRNGGGDEGAGGDGSKEEFRCYVFESSTSAEKISLGLK